MKKKPHDLSLCCLAALLLVATAHADTLWATHDEIPTFFNSGMTGQSVKTPLLDTEVADDFNVIGTIDKVLADGNDCQGCYSNQPVTGVWVRFYEWTQNGPGALQYEAFLANGDPNFIWSPGSGPEYLQITLPEPFEATGWHFVSVQVAFSTQSVSTGKWYFYPVNWGATMGASAYVRDNNGSGNWSPLNPVRDASFALIGTYGGETPMSILSATSNPITPSARLRINGDGFGDEQWFGEVLINDVPAIVTQWTDTVIIAYIPEQTVIGEATLSVHTSGGESDTLQIDVQPRQSDGQIAWRFAVDADFMIHRPGVAPPGSDGSIYFNDYNHGRLYKVNAEGGLEWIVDALRGQTGLGGEGPVVVGDDGTVYVAVNPLGPTTDLVAFNPDGSIKWEFIEPDSWGVAAGPAIGPDGNVYVAFYDAEQECFGLTSFTPDGFFRWNNPGDPFLYEHGGLGAELVFGSSVGGGEIDQVVLTVDRDDDPWLYAFDMESGAQNWAVQRGVTEYFMQNQIQPETGTDGQVYMSEFIGFSGLGWALWAFDAATGERLWYYDPDILSAASGPEVGPDGTIYFSWDISRVGAVTKDGDPLWTHIDFTGVRTMPTVTNDNNVVMVGGGNFGESGTFKALDAKTGEELWKVQLQDENGNIVPDVRPLATSDSQMSYWPTVIVADSEAFQYCYLYAVHVGEPDGPPATPGDLNGDSVIGVADLTILLGSWGPCVNPSVCPADLTGDGAVGVGDLLMLLDGWG